MSTRPAPGDTPLIAAVRQGRLDEVERLATSGLDLDAANARGETALHVATRTARADIAGCLLSHGADHGGVDARGRRALDPDTTDVDVLHAVRQHYQRYRFPDVRDARPDDPIVSRCVGELDAKGIVRLGAIDPALLAQLRADFADFVADLDVRIESDGAVREHYDQEAYFWSEDRAYVTNNFFRYSAALAGMACSSPMVDIARLYLGKPAFVQRAVAMRYLPAESDGHHMFRYHHDLVDKRMKMMILLTDVGPDDQFMSYATGSHSLFHPYSMFRANACPLEYCERHLGAVEIFRTLGAAGDVFLFDSNGAHKGNRSPGGRTRDALFVEFSAASTPQFGGDIPPEVFEDHPLVETNPLYVMAHAPKAWEARTERRSNPTWVEDLPRPSTWVWNPPGSPSRA
jgi:hypothetical protein